MHFESDIFISQPHVMKGVLATYSSSRCRCDSTMVMGQCGRGREGSVGRRWILCSCCALLSQEMSCADPSNTGKDELCAPMPGSWFCPDSDKDSDWEKGNAGICPPTGWLQGQEKWRACRPVTSKVYTASGEEREGKSALGMHDR